MKNNMKRGKRGTINQISFWLSTISVKFREPAKIRVDIKMSPKDTSYETICAVDLKAPRKAYLELLDHPAMITPYTPKDDTAKR
jgi:hypothetical protein